MRGKRLLTTLRLYTLRSGVKRAQYLKDKGIFAHIGEGCSFQDRQLPLYPNLIKFGNNVHTASNIGFVTHDIAYKMLNKKYAEECKESGKKYKERVGCIEVGDNVFIGSGTRILYDVKIGSNVIIGSGSVVNRDVPDNTVVAGVPAKQIGTFEEFVAKYENATDYPAEQAPGREVVCDALAEVAWEDFYEKRK